MLHGQLSDPVGIFERILGCPMTSVYQRPPASAISLLTFTTSPLFLSPVCKGIIDKS